MLVVFRVLTGGASASVLAVGAGTIADLWESRERGRAMSAFYLGPLLGPLVAPIVGGALAQHLGWRSTMYFLAVYGAVILLLLFFLLPETLARRRIDDAPADFSRVSTAWSARLWTRPRRPAPRPALPALPARAHHGARRRHGLRRRLRRQHLGAAKFSAPPYSFGQLVVGLLYIPAGLGYLMTALLGGRWIDSIMAREARRAKRYDDKGRLVYLFGLLLFGWTLHFGVIWIVPSVGSFFFGLSSMLVFSAATTMLTEFVRTRSSAGVAVNNFVRNMLSCLGIVIAAPWIDAMGTGLAFTIVALVCMAAGYVGIWALRRNAPRWRRQMDEALKMI